MKKFILLFMGVIAMPTLYAQDITDAVRYSVDDLSGTARFRALSGAFGALGGDMSGVSINPAGSAIFNRGYLSLSLGNFWKDNSTTYLGNRNNSSQSDFDLNQSGATFVFNNMDISSPWRKVSMSLLYEQTQNYNDVFFASGINQNSIDSYFLEYAQGKRLDEISAFENETISQAYGEIGSFYGFQHQQAFLGFESFILEPEDINDDANTAYTSNIAAGNFNQDYSYASTGYNGKFTFNLATQYRDNFFIGVNLNSHFLNYRQSTYLYESNDNQGSLITDVGFENNLYTTGAGFSFQLGTIVKVNDILRVGFTYDSPIWYRLQDETNQYLFTDREDMGDFITTIIDPLVINVFPSYKLNTPEKFTGSLALVGRIGLLSFDYSRKNYGRTKFKPESDSFFSVQNSLISNNLGVSSTYRVGGELRYKQFSFRGGYRFEESPYKDTNFYGDLNGYSFGMGYSFGNFKMDISYQHSERTINRQLYSVGLTDTARINNNNSDIIGTLSFSL